MCNKKLVQLGEKPSRVTPFQWKGHLTCSRLSCSGEDAKERGKLAKVKGARFIFHFPAFSVPADLTSWVPGTGLRSSSQRAKRFSMYKHFGSPSRVNLVKGVTIRAHTSAIVSPWLEQKGSIFFNARFSWLGKEGDSCLPQNSRNQRNVCQISV